MTTFSDNRAITREERLKIGFAQVKDSWQSAKATFTDKTLEICGHPVMESWEETYMRTLADIACLNGGIVLEVGFGLGISAGFIQTHKITGHIIIEANDDVLARAETFSEKSPAPVRLIAGFWEDAIDKIPDATVSGILFDTYPLSEAEIHCNHFNFLAHAHRILIPDGVLTYYSDEISDFSPAHLAKLRSVGFANIDKIICAVEPPLDCRYWKNDTIIAPIIIK